MKRGKILLLVFVVGLFLFAAIAAAAGGFFYWRSRSVPRYEGKTLYEWIVVAHDRDDDTRLEGMMALIKMWGDGGGDELRRILRTETDDDVAANSMEAIATYAHLKAVNEEQELLKRELMTFYLDKQIPAIARCRAAESVIEFEDASAIIRQFEQPLRECLDSETVFGPLVVGIAMIDRIDPQAAREHYDSLTEEERERDYAILMLEYSQLVRQIEKERQLAEQEAERKEIERGKKILEDMRRQEAEAAAREQERLAKEAAEKKARRELVTVFNPLLRQLKNEQAKIFLFKRASDIFPEKYRADLDLAQSNWKETANKLRKLSPEIELEQFYVPPNEGILSAWSDFVTLYETRTQLDQNPEDVNLGYKYTKLKERLGKTCRQIRIHPDDIQDLGALKDFWPPQQSLPAAPEELPWP